MKKIIVPLLILVLSLTIFTSCSGSNTDTTSNNATTTEATTKETTNKETVTITSRNKAESLNITFDTTVLTLTNNFTSELSFTVSDEKSELNEKAFNLTFISDITAMEDYNASLGDASVVIKFTKPEKITDGNDVLILSLGRMAETAIHASKLLAYDGISASVINLRCVKPFNMDYIERESTGKKLIVTIEDNITAGGMGQYVLSQLNTGARTLILGFDTCFVPHGKQEELFRIHGLDADSVYNRIKTFYKGMTL